MTKLNDTADTPLDFTKPVQTRDGRAVRILCTDRKGPEGISPVVGLIEINGRESFGSWTAEGLYAIGTRPEEDLVQAPQKLYANVFEHRTIWSAFVIGDVYTDISYAQKEALEPSTIYKFIKTIEITI